MISWRAPRLSAGARANSWKKSPAPKPPTSPAAASNAASLIPQGGIGRFKPLADFDWHWPQKIDRPLIERVLTLDFLTEARNFLLIGTNGLGKTMIAKNIAHAAVLAGHSVLFRTAADLLADLDGDSPGLRRRKFRFYARPALLAIDECGYLSYDAHAADLLFEVINHRYEHNSILLTTNKAFPRIAIDGSAKPQKRRSPSRDVCYRDLVRNPRHTPGG